MIQTRCHEGCFIKPPDWLDDKFKCVCTWNYSWNPKWWKYCPGILFFQIISSSGWSFTHSWVGWEWILRLQLKEPPTTPESMNEPQFLLQMQPDAQLWWTNWNVFAKRRVAFQQRDDQESGKLKGGGQQQGDKNNQQQEQQWKRIHFLKS